MQLEVIIDLILLGNPNKQHILWRLFAGYDFLE